MNEILLRTINLLAEVSSLRRLRILRLTRYFTTVQLDDGSVGCCMSYYRLPDTTLVIAELRLFDALRHGWSSTTDLNSLDRLLSDVVTNSKERFLVLSSVLATLTSALSANTLQQNSSEDFTASQSLPANWTCGANTALVVGLGGLLNMLAAQPAVTLVHTIDFHFHPEKQVFVDQFNHLRALYPDKKFTGSVSLSSPDDLKAFDLISITGSTLCNGTLEPFLESVRRDSIVILQGQSGSIHPKFLFEAGVTWVATTIKPAILVELSQVDRSGDAMKHLLSGNLPIVYLGHCLPLQSPTLLKRPTNAALLNPSTSNDSQHRPAVTG